MKLDNYEKELEAAFAKGKIKRSKNEPEQMKKAVEAARNYGKKNRRMNIRISEFDLRGLKARAMEEGIPYQTLVSSLIHKFVTRVL